MSRIALLSEAVASQVAAGEVVERPASLVKELVENSLDAKARSVEIAIQRGGISLVRVVDDGHGMDRDDALLCLERHATSKIRTGHDLAAIATLGFRGEALPSIASVSKFRLSTREPGALAGTEVLVSGGKIETVRDAGDAPGTCIEVRSLFYNLPARRKFLRTEATESAHIESQLHLLALAHPAVRFVHVRDGKTVFQLPPVKRLLDRIRDLCGEEDVAELTEVDVPPLNGLKITGYLGRAGVSRSTRAGQRVFINGRTMENGIVSQALREGYHTTLMKGRYPVTYLFVEMDPAAVDVNVHPSKREVRFREPGIVREAIVTAVRRTLEAGRTEWTRSFHQPTLPAPAPRETAKTPDLLRNDEIDFRLRQERSTPTAPPTPLAETFAQPPPSTVRADKSDRIGWDAPAPREPGNSTTPIIPVASFLTPEPLAVTTSKVDEAVRATIGDSLFAASDLRELSAIQDRREPQLRPRAANDPFNLLGVLGRLYVLMENANGLVLVDQHAAHERILFEELRRRLENNEIISQKLLLPHTLQIPPKDADWLRQHLPSLQKMGIGLEEFGAGVFLLDSVPPFLDVDQPLPLVREIIDSLQGINSATSRVRLGEDVIAKTVCRHAVKANDKLRERELIRLIEDLLACELPYCCPHGRPTMIQISYAELERKFGRRHVRSVICTRH